MSRAGPFLHVQRPWRFVAILWLVALVARLLSLTGLPPTLAYGTQVYFDEMDHDSLARNLLSRRSFHSCAAGFLTQATRPPGYPCFLAALYAVIGRGVGIVRCAQALLDSLNVVILFALIRRLGFASGVALAGAAVMAVFGPSVGMVPFLHDITLSGVALNAFLLLLVVVRRAPSGVVPLGVAGAACALIRPSFVAVSAGACVSLWMAPGPPSRRLRRVAAFALALAVCLAPWVVRCSLLMGRPVLISTAPAWHLYAFGSSTAELPDDDFRERLFRDAKTSEAAVYATGMDMAARRFREHPWRALAAGVHRLYRWSGLPAWPRRFYRPEAYVAFVGQAPFRFPLPDFEGMAYATALFTLVWLAVKRRVPRAGRPWLARWAPVFWPVGVYVAAHILSAPRSHHRLMIEPVLSAAMLTWVATLVFGERCLDPEPEPAPLNLGTRTVVFAAVAAIAIGTVGIIRAQRFKAPPTGMYVQAPGPTYDDVRRVQRRHGGRLGPMKGKRVLWSGSVSYAAKGWRFRPGAPYRDMACARDPYGCVARLEIYDTRDNKAGEGVVRLNAHACLADALSPGNDVQVGGRLVGVTCFGVPIVEVDGIEP